MGMAIEKARVYNVAAITVFRQGHIGRLGDYPTMAAQQGMIGLITADSGAGPGTNPICIGVPSHMDGTVLLDMAASAVAAGKIGLDRNRKESIPSTWVIDKEGNPTTDPNDYYQGGAIRPVGADQGTRDRASSSWPRCSQES